MSCAKCGEKDIKKLVRGSPYEYKACKRNRSKESYINNIETYRKRAPRRRCASRKLIREIKSRPCEICGHKYHYSQMDFDHVNQDDKRLPISKMSLMGQESIEKEVRKCRVVCVNCHRDETQKQPNCATVKNPKKKSLTAAKNLLILLKDGKICMDCENPHPYWRLDYDHDPKKGKTLTISAMKNGGYTEKAIMEEIKKCDLVCANCHRMRTWNRMREKSGIPDL